MSAETEALTPAVLIVSQLGLAPVAGLLAAYGMQCELVGDAESIPGSFWGDSEAGLVGHRLLVRGDTPVHSALHEASHYVCMTAARRSGLHTDAGGDYAEENAVCYLQILLADYLPGVGSQRLMRDMDAWGYSFRLGSAIAWFEHDAEDARDWLLARGLIDADNRPTWVLRGDQSAEVTEHDKVAIADGLDLQFGEATVLELQSDFPGPVRG